MQPDFECLQGHGIHHFSWQPVPVPHHPYHKTLFLIYSLNFPFLIETISLVLSQQTLLKSLSPFFLQTYSPSPPPRLSLPLNLKLLKDHSRVALELSLLQAEQPQPSQPVLVRKVFCVVSDTFLFLKSRCSF